MFHAKKDPDYGLNRFKKNSEMILSLSTTAKVAILPAEAITWHRDEVGATTYELQGSCVTDMITNPRQRAQHGIALRRLDQPWGRGLPYALMHYRHTIAALTWDRTGTPRLTRRRFASEAEALTVLSQHKGQWLIAKFTGSGLHPRLAHTDPFTLEVAVAGSYIAMTNSGLYGPFQGALEHFGAWVLQHFGGHYAAVPLLERVAIVHNTKDALNNAATAQGVSNQAEWYVFTDSGTENLVGCFRHKDEALKAAQALGVLCLLARQVDCVSLY